MAQKKIKRAISLAGGGPAVGLSLGALKKLCVEEKIEFDVYTTACIGAWVATTFNMGHKAPVDQRYETSLNFFKQVFRPDDQYARFPIATIFAPNYKKLMMNAFDFMTQPDSYRNLVLPQYIWESIFETWRFMQDPTQWSEGNINAFILNQLTAPNPFGRFLTSMIYLSNDMKGISQVYYPDSSFLKQLDFESLYKADAPHIYHNAYNLTQNRLEQFSNKPNDGHRDMDAQSLCACSALPYIIEPVTIGDEIFCEGATVDTVNFEGVLNDHQDIDEVWVSRILDRKQVRHPENLYNALNNLVMLFAATTSEDDVKLFQYHLWESQSPVRVVEIHVNHHINYDWTYSNLEHAIAHGYEAAGLALKEYREVGPKRFDGGKRVPVAAAE